jgi:hypothetical protein
MIPVLEKQEIYDRIENLYKALNNQSVNWDIILREQCRTAYLR